MDNAEEKKKTRDPLTIIQKIRDGVIDPEKDEITPEERRDCVEALKSDGQTNASIARFLKCDVKTVHRDMKAVYKNYIDAPSDENNLLLVSEFLAKARANYDQQVRLSNSKEGEHEHKVQGARFAGEALRETVKILQSLGYLPKEAMKIQGDIHHHQVEEKSPDQLKKELSDFEKNASETGRLTPELQEKINGLRKRIELNAVDREISDLKCQSLNQDDQGGAANAGQ